MNGQVLALLALSALCFTSWPFLMSQSRLHYVIAAFILNAISAIVFMPFLKEAARNSSFTKTAILWGLGAGLLNGLGHYFYQQVVAGPTEPSRYITVVLVMMVVIAVGISFGLSLTTLQAHATEPFTVKKIIGALFAIFAIVLLTQK
ncbi:MAG: hypothetical protein HYT13_01235 [Candidatus Liptonbacteria bacterium]|nr:hypothetical protein [Candidatus Liptonbacteria bacterium]